MKSLIKLTVKSWPLISCTGSNSVILSSVSYTRIKNEKILFAISSSVYVNISKYSFWSLKISELLFIPLELPYPSSSLKKNYQRENTINIQNKIIRKLTLHRILTFDNVDLYKKTSSWTLIRNSTSFLQFSQYGTLKKG